MTDQPTTSRSYVPAEARARDRWAALLVAAGYGTPTDCTHINDRGHPCGLSAHSGGKHA